MITLYNNRKCKSSNWLKAFLLVQLTLFTVQGFINAQGIIIPPSPNAANFTSDNAGTVSLYTGKATINIPIYTIEAGNISLPIALSYSTGGIRVGEIASWCGLGWTLQAGGVVTRSIVGFPDETPTVGYNAFNIMQDIPPADNRLYNLTCDQSSNYCKFAIGKADGEPDQYFFSLPGASGKIINSWGKGYQIQPVQNINFTKQVGEVPFGNWANTVNYGSFCGSAFNSHIPVCIKNWTFRDGVGNRFEFFDGEQMAVHTRNILSGGGIGFFNIDSDTCYKVINSWYLSSISPTNGDTNSSVYFKYDSLPLTYDLPTSIQLTSKIAGSGPSNLNGSSEVRILQTVHQKKIAAIYFPDGVIKFIPTSQTRADFVGDKALGKIIIENRKGEIIKQFIFSYKYLVGNKLYRYDSTYSSAGSGLLYHWNTNLPEGNFSGRLILESVTEQDKNGNPLNKGTKFNYIQNIGLPERDSEKTDFWGFYNGYSGTTIITDPNGGMDIAPGSKDPSFMHASQGSLEKINYPYGSSTQYIYSDNRARLPNPTSSGFAPNETPVGGINVLTVSTVDSLTSKEYIKSYVYANGFATSVPSVSYNFKINQGTPGEETYKVLSLNSFYPLTTTQGGIVGYSYVKEVDLKNTIGSGDLADKGKTEYFYLSPESFPDSVFYIGQPPSRHINSPIDDRDWLRGYLKEQKVFATDASSSDGYKLKQHTINSYVPVWDTLGRAIQGGINEYGSDGVPYSYHLIPYRMLNGRMELRDIDERVYEQGREMRKMINITYNKKNYLPAKMTTFIPYSETYQETFTYAADFNTSPYINFPSLLVENLQFRNSPGELVLMRGKLIQYDAFANVTNTFNLRIDTPIINNAGFKYSHLPFNTLPNWGNDPSGPFQPDRRYYAVESFKRDQYNNGVLNELETLQEGRETYLWGYAKGNNKYLLAKILGSGHMTASSLIRQSFLDSAIHFSDARIRIELNKLRVNLPGAFVTTYTYAPLVGITSETAPNGKTIFYEYDSFGRPIRVKDHENNILKRMCYNASGQLENCSESLFYSAPKSGTFTRNDCSGGTTVTYNVIAGAYTSSISQGDADQKAQNDVNSNGQAYANTMGKCSLYGNVEMSAKFTRNNCGSGYIGSVVVYSVPASTYTSTLSLYEANKKALRDISLNGQNYADTVGTCTQFLPYARLELTNIHTDQATNVTYANVQVKFTADQGGTVPYAVSNLRLYLAISSQFTDNSSHYTDPYLEFDCNGSTLTIIQNAIISGFDPNFSKTVSSRLFLLPSVGDYHGIN